jgi:D-glycerate 3-kinase
MDDEQNTRAALQAVLARFIQEASLPDSVAFNFMRWYAGVTGSLAQRARAAHTPPLVGFSGCQGSGKSTLVALVAKVMREVHGVSTVVLSLDDFYLTKAARAALAESIHPLFATRGVPGTHDLALLNETIAALRQPWAGGAVPVPAFDKALDDRTEMVHWRQVSAPVQLIFLEGWCVGLSPQQESELEAPINPMEAEQDPSRVWRGEVNRQLANEYADLYGKLDALLLLQAPSFDAVFEWRWQQEQRLSQQFQQDHPDKPDPTMSRSEVTDFILHYQRLTEHGLRTLPDRADFVWELATDRSVERMWLTEVAA